MWAVINSVRSGGTFEEDVAGVRMGGDALEEGEGVADAV
jgi:hypothetical protein